LPPSNSTVGGNANTLPSFGKGTAFLSFFSSALACSATFCAQAGTATAPNATPSTAPNPFN
jgi:hypothetical protein